MEKPTFKNMCMMYIQQLTNFPFIEQDFDFITNYEFLCLVVEHLNQVITNSNTQNDAITNLYNAFVELKDYVDNYFDNLDVQEEINNKLDEMVEDGTLAEIINEELFKELQSIKLIVPKNFEGSIDSGESCLILTKTKSILYDTNRSSALGDVINYLDRYIEKPLDYVIISHYHDDHVGNFVSLFENGYITEDTQILLPAYSSLIEQSESTLAYYNAVQACINNNNLNARIPDLEEEITIDNTKFKFYNCDTTLFGTMGVTNYNDCSMMVLITHGKEKTLLTGDVVDKPFIYLANNKKMNFDISNYQIEHHGYSMTNSVIPFLKMINPINSFAFNTKYVLETKNCCVRSTSLSYMTNKNGNNVIQGYNEDDTIFEIHTTYTKIIGKITNTQSSYGFTNTIYVDASVDTDAYQIGTQLFPYKSIQQALSKINKDNYANNIINLANGTYTFAYHIITSACNLTINGNSNDNTAVKITNRLSFYDCVNLSLNNLSIEVTDAVPLVINNSNASITNCIIKSTSDNNGIAIDNSRVFITNSTIDSCNNGIYATNSIINMDTNTFSNNVRGYRFAHVVYSSLSETFTDNTTSNYLVQTSSNITSSEKEVNLLDGYNTVLETDDVVTLDYDITKCSKVAFCFGRYTDGTWNTNTVYAPGSHFNVNDTFRVKSLSSYIYFKITESNKIQAINIYSTAQALRKIIGYMQ